MLEAKQISQNCTVSEILEEYPATSRVFIEKKTFCLGCYMARFCNLRDVARVYNLETEALVSEVQQATINKTLQNLKE